MRVIESTTPWTHSENPARSRNIYYIYIYFFCDFFLFFSSFLLNYRSIGFFAILSLNLFFVFLFFLIFV